LGLALLVPTRLGAKFAPSPHLEICPLASKKVRIKTIRSFLSQYEAFVGCVTLSKNVYVAVSVHQPKKKLFFRRF
jgi:hypothetical protein